MVGVFDLGSNSFISLVLNGKREIMEDIKVTAVAFHVKDGYIQNCEEFKKDFEDMKNKVKKYTNNIHVFGTAIFRETKNGKDCFDYIKGDHKGKILSGEEEAHYSYLSVLWDEELNLEHPVVYDLGGGSLEILDGSSAVSLPLGTKKVKDMLKERNAEDVVRYIKSLLKAPSGQAAGIGGTFVVIVASIIKEWNLREIHGFKLTADELDRVMEKLFPMSEREIADLPYIPQGREKTIKPGMVVVKALLELCGEIVVSRRGYRYAIGWELEKSVPGGI